ncbi:FAD-dependent oxidoreductase [Amycolatopsis pithecellobii]|uniref:FAD-dependent oxidoreductase n=1 Tax=Amycolatopsis pithecellobii TaxID=664692 RepID=A0A6N7YPP8_9PSEU|nr:FAD-dependent oxidoreductase [Amycolatopsis pithecellobii]MTD54977.1 FAD-dependent oxidoreductase [Amycolatopsis pithecellobii]
MTMSQALGPQSVFDVLVVGAGPVGLATALQLGRAGAKVRVLERRAGPSDQPRAHVVNGRTMELFRSWGLAEAVRADGLPPDLATTFGWVTEIGAEDFATIPYVDDVTAERCAPETLCSCPQDRVEARLLAAVSDLDTVTISQGHEVVAYRAVGSGGGVLGEVDVLGPGGARATARGRYVIAADGASSPMRRLAGIRMERSVPLGRMLNLYFFADLTPFTHRRPHILWFVHNPKTQGILITLDGARRWVYSIDLGDGETEDDYGPERCEAVIRDAVGDDKLEIDLRARLTWSLDMGVAERFRNGPLFLVGDAAHRFPPTGGFGMNSGIQDGHNLAWKVDHVLRGLAGDALLDTYEAERRPVAVFNATQSMLNAEQLQEASAFLNAPETLALLGSPEGAGLRAGIHANLQRTREQFHSLGQQFGHVYRGEAVVADGSPAKDSTITEYRMTARPGARAPHARLDAADGSRRGVSTVDLVTGEWTVLAAGDARPWRAGVVPPGLTLRVHGIHSRPTADAEPGDFVDAGDPGYWQELYEVDDGGAVLVRPDGHVLARWARPPGDPATAVADALASVLTPAGYWQPAEAT